MRKEILFQIALHFLVLLFYTFDKRNGGFREDLVWLFLNYTMATIFISYYLMPKYLYAGKTWYFLFSIAAVILGVIFIEEYIMEPLVYPSTTRSQQFAGIFPTLLDVIPPITILAGGKFGWDALQKQKEIDALEGLVQESELQFLRSQIHPHFLFNNLNNLYAYALENSPKTPEIILGLSGVLRYMLYECKEDYVPLEKEIQQLENFIRLYELQIEERGSVHFQTVKSSGIYKIAPLILVVFIENAFKHSQTGQTKNIKIWIDIELQDEWLRFTCTNNFQPMDGYNTDKKGIGLENVRKRLDLLYLNRHSLDITQKDDLYTVVLELRLENEMP